MNRSHTRCARPPATQTTNSNQCVNQDRFIQRRKLTANQGPFTPSASTSVYVCASRASTCVDARLRPSTDVDGRRRASTPIIKIHAKRPARLHQARLRPSTDVNALKIDHGTILSSSTPVYVSRRASTRVDGRRRT